MREGGAREVVGAFVRWMRVRERIERKKNGRKKRAHKTRERSRQTKQKEGGKKKLLRREPQPNPPVN